MVPDRQPTLAHARRQPLGQRRPARGGRPPAGICLSGSAPSGIDPCGIDPSGSGSAPSGMFSGVSKEPDAESGGEDLRRG